MDCLSRDTSHRYPYPWYNSLRNIAYSDRRDSGLGHNRRRYSFGWSPGRSLGRKESRKRARSIEYRWSRRSIQPGLSPANTGWSQDRYHCRAVEVPVSFGVVRRKFMGRQDTYRGTARLPLAGKQQCRRSPSSHEAAGDDGNKDLEERHHRGLRS